MLECQFDGRLEKDMILTFRWIEKRFNTVRIGALGIEKEGVRGEFRQIQIQKILCEPCDGRTIGNNYIVLAASPSQD